MSSVIEYIGKSVIQHDKDNNRVYLMKLHKDDMPSIIISIEKIARENNYSKIFIKIPVWAKGFFVEEGYIVEAEIPNLYKGIEDGILGGKYLCDDRKEMKDKDIIESVLINAIEKRNSEILGVLPVRYVLRVAEESDAGQLAKFYKKIFEIYPFPLDDENYILETMKSNVVYFTIWRDNQLAAAASCEIDEEMLNVEMTDFGTMSEYRGMGFAGRLLVEMEKTMKVRGIKTAYTIARAVSYGMNITFSKLGYNFAGTLLNNTNISSGIESMNVWFKEL